MDFDMGECNSLEWLSAWYFSNCDGDWEHDFGVTIETLDNPGWSITIDLKDTDVRVRDFEWKYYEQSDRDWYGYRVMDGKFFASGDPFKLDFLIGIFRNLVENPTSI